MDVKDLLGKVADHISVGRAFGPAYEKDGSLIIPVALVAGGGGGGGSHAPEFDASLTGDSSKNHDASVTGSGGGFGGVVLPVGVYVVNGERVRWMPAVNVTLIALAAVGVLRVVASSQATSRRHRH
ncbi:MAG TPA: spore germination protein GerW family protein [Acidimicrobiales bacterium]